MAPLAAALLTLAIGVHAQRAPRPIPNTFPQNYSGIPQGDFGPDWQDYFLVKDPLPNVTFTLPRSYAGNIPVNRAGHPNDTLFFWAFEKAPGSLTANASADAPWLIWLNGGPGSSSFLGMLFENGPLHIADDLSAVDNPFSWDKLADAIWVDQPVGTGFSTADTTGYIANEDQMGQDFVGFLSNLVKVFPSLATRPFFLTGESYAGMYIPYITKTLIATLNPPVKLAKIAIGDGAIGALATFEELPALSVIETYPQLVNFDPDVHQYFKNQTHLCGLDLNMTYPMNGTFPTLSITPPSVPGRAEFLLQRKIERFVTRTPWTTELRKRSADTAGLTRRARHAGREAWKRDLSLRSNDSIDPFYGCFLFDEMLDYASNFSFPWTNGGFDVYEIPDALDPEAPQNGNFFMNDNRTRAALHAPTSKNWSSSFSYPFGSTRNRTPGANEFGDPSVEAVVLLDGIAAAGVPMVIYSGNADSLVAHRGTEVTIQNFTFGGVQGFSRKPSTAWFDDSGGFSGIVHQERGVAYVLFDGAGHLVPQWRPAQAMVFVREFVLGNNATGLVNGSKVVGGENATLRSGMLFAGAEPIFYGNGTTAASTVWPTATVQAWQKLFSAGWRDAPVQATVLIAAIVGGMMLVL